MKALIREIMPPVALKVYDMVRSLTFKKMLSPNIALKDRHRDRKRCFVLGNGPSLRDQDLSPLKDEIVFVCNFFNLHPQCREVAPRYYCLDDPNAFFSETTTNDLGIERSSWFLDICDKTPQVEFLVPAEAKPVIVRNHWFAGHTIWYVARGLPSCILNVADSDLRKAIPHSMGTVPAIAIPAAIYMGFPTIYLLGCDCNWWVQHVVKEDFDAEFEHFYDRNPYLIRESNLRDFGLEVELRCLADHFQGMRLLREHALRKGVHIFNATQGGILDVFPRVSLKKVLAESAQGDTSSLLVEGDKGRCSHPVE
jgi:hypothetical protein